MPSASAAAATAGARHFFTGIYTGLLLIIVMLAALVAANRIPALEPYALERNAISYTLFVLLMLAPVCRFRNSSLQMFLSAMLGWVFSSPRTTSPGWYFTIYFRFFARPSNTDRRLDRLRRPRRRVVGCADDFRRVSRADPASPPPH